MSFLKESKPRAAESADTGRRSFFWKLGAGVSAAVASTTGLARAESAATSENTAGDELALRKLHQAYEKAVDKGLHDDVIAMFAEDAEVVFNGSAFRNRSEGVSRLYRDLFPSGKTGKSMEPAPGFEVDAEQQRDRVEVAADRLSAKAVFPYSIQVGMPIESETSLASMARLHGEGVRTWWEGGVYDVSYTKLEDGRWKIRRLEYRTLSRADYRAGRSHARAMTV
jgi:hypothetical protein